MTALERLVHAEERHAVVASAQSDGRAYGDVYLEQLESSVADVPALVNALRAVLADLRLAQQNPGSALSDFAGGIAETIEEALR